MTLATLPIASTRSRRASAQVAATLRVAVRHPEQPARSPSHSTHDDAVTRAIIHLARHWDAPPSLDELANQVAHMSPAHFQRRFRARAGISPKRFCQHLTLTRAKDLLARRVNLLDASLNAGLSGPSRLHDLFVAAEAMTPGEYKARGRSLVIRWGVCESPIGPALLAVTERGICWLGFAAQRQDIEKLGSNWSEATLLHDQRAVAPIARSIFTPATTGPARFGGQARSEDRLPLPVLLRGTNFQIQVWRALLRIPHGAIATYGDVARSLEDQMPGATRAVRAVAAACGTNPVSYVIPCHRVIQSTGALCGYGWGLDKKRALLALEQAGG